MSAHGKNVPVVLALLLVLGTAAHFMVHGRLEKQIAADAAKRSKLLTDLRTENRKLLKQSQELATAAETPMQPMPQELPDKVRQMKAATELLKTGLFGPYAWTRGQNNSIADEVSELADALGLSAVQKEEMRSAAEKGENEVVAAVLATAKVQINENSVRGPTETREDAEERSREFEGASPLRAMAISARMQSKQASSLGEREVAIEIPASLEARAAFDAMQASFAQIMGPAVYAFYESAGSSQTIEGMFNELGLQPHWLSLISRPAGTTSAGDALMNFARNLSPRRTNAGGGAPPPAQPTSVSTAPANQLGVVYEFHRIRSFVSMPESIIRSVSGRGGRGGGSDPLSGIIETTGVSMGSSQAITGDALRSAMGPLQSLIPAGFLP